MSVVAVFLFLAAPTAVIAALYGVGRAFSEDVLEQDDSGAQQ